MEPPIPPHLALGDLGKLATQHLRLGEIRDTGFLRPHLCRENFMVRVTEETVHGRGRAEKNPRGGGGDGAEIPSQGSSPTTCRAGQFLRLSETGCHDAFPDTVKGSVSFDWVPVMGDTKGHILKSRDITLPTKVRLVKAMVFPVVTYGCDSWTIKEANRRRIDAFELWCWRRLLRVP